MEAVSSSASSANPNHLPLSQLPTFVTQHNTVHSSKQVPTSAIDQQGENIQHVTSSGGSVMVIQQPQQPGAPSIGLVASAVSSAQSATSVAGQVSSEHPQIGGLYTTATGIPGEYVMPGTNMIQSGAQGFHVHVPVVPQQEGSSEGKCFLTSCAHTVSYSLPPSSLGLLMNHSEQLLLHCILNFERSRNQRQGSEFLM